MIKVFLIDDEYLAIKELEFLMEDYKNVEIIGKFINPIEALKALEEQIPDVVFLDIDMPCMNGLELALKIQNLKSRIDIVFVTAYSKYCLEAFEIYAIDYILKPIGRERFQKTMERLVENNRLKLLDDKYKKSPYIKCFGKLEVAKEEEEKKILKLGNGKTKELFAYLINRHGKPVTKQDILKNVFNDIESPKALNNLYVIMYNIRKLLKEFAIDRSIISINDNYTIEISNGVCDFVDFTRFIADNPSIDKDNIENAEKAAEIYKGAYLEQEDYPWAIETREWLEKENEEMLLKMALCYYSLGKIFELNSNTSIDDEYISRKVDVSISKNIEARYNKLYLLTDIQVFGETKLTNYQCSLTIPKRIMNLDLVNNPIKELRFQYIINEKPGFAWETLYI